MNGKTITVAQAMAKFSKMKPDAEIVIVNGDWEDEGLAVEVVDGRTDPGLNSDSVYIRFATHDEIHLQS